MGNCQNLSAGTDPVKADKAKKNNGNNLIIKAYTWSRDSHGLFDYESKSINKTVLKIPEPSVVLRDKEEIKIIPAAEFKDENNLNVKKLASIDIRDNHYMVDSDFMASIEEEKANNLKRQIQSERGVVVVAPAPADGNGAGAEQVPIVEQGTVELCVWAVIKSLKTSKGAKGFELSVGNYLKLGRVRFRIKELMGVENNNNNNNPDPKNLNNQKFFFGSNVNILNMDELSPKAAQEDEKIETASNCQSTCRICLGDNDEPDNPFITPCKCDGTMKCIHIKCLQQWLKSRLHPKQTPYSISFVWKTFDCELCKHQFPNMVKINGQVYDTVEIPRPAPPYVTLEILSKDKNICKGIHVITLSQKNQIRLGRGHDSDIRISDISVSRCHALLSYDAGIFAIEDNNSKFGTLALVNEPIQLNNANNNITVQIGRTVLSFVLKKNWKIYQAPVPPQAKKAVESVGSEKKSVVTAKTKMTELKGEEGNGKNEKLRLEDQCRTQAVAVFNMNSNSLVPTRKLNVGDKNNSQIGENNNKNANGNEDGDNNGNNNAFQLPDFKDPAEELEAFQNQKEKESEIETLEKQLVLLTQHKKLNEQSLQHAQEVENTMEQATLKNRINQYSQKIEEIQQRLLILLAQNKKSPLKVTNVQQKNSRGPQIINTKNLADMNQIFSEQSEHQGNQSFRKNEHMQESMFGESSRQDKNIEEVEEEKDNNDNNGPRN